MALGVTVSLTVVAGIKNALVEAGLSACRVTFRDLPSGNFNHFKEPSSF